MTHVAFTNTPELFAAVGSHVTPRPPNSVESYQRSPSFHRAAETGGSPWTSPHHHHHIIRQLTPKRDQSRAEERSSEVSLCLLLPLCLPLSLCTWQSESGGSAPAARLPHLRSIASQKFIRWHKTVRACWRHSKRMMPWVCVAATWAAGERKNKNTLGRTNA